MSKELIEKERIKYEKMWKLAKYRERSPGMRTIEMALEKAHALIPPKRKIKTFLDIGAGTGRVSKYVSQKGYDVVAVDIAANAVKEFDGVTIVLSISESPVIFPKRIEHIDPTQPAKESDLSDLIKFDLAFCADVMEHIPTELVDVTLENIAKSAKMTWFQIANFYCHQGDEIGEELHLTVESFEWWVDRMMKHFKPMYMEKSFKHHYFLVGEK